MTTIDKSGEFRGYDEEGHRVVVGWMNADGSEYLIGLTHCCGASSKGGEDGIVCRKCYGDCSPSLGADAHVVRGPDDGSPVVVPATGWKWTETDGRWRSEAPTTFVVLSGATTLFGPASLDECHEAVV